MNDTPTTNSPASGPKRVERKPIAAGQTMLPPGVDTGLPPPQQAARQDKTVSHDPGPSEEAAKGKGREQNLPKNQRSDFKRKPFGGVRFKLTAERREGYHRHWFNDVGGRVKDAFEAGYAHVKDEGGKPIHTTVGVLPQGGGLKAFLMEIPLEWFKEDMAAKKAVDDEIDTAIRGGNIARKDDDQRYIPDQGIRVGD